MDSLSPTAAIQDAFSDKEKSNLKFMYTWDAALFYCNSFFAVLALITSAYNYLAKVNCDFPLDYDLRVNYIEAWCASEYVHTEAIMYGLWVQSILLFIPYSAFYLAHGDRVQELSRALNKRIEEFRKKSDTLMQKEFLAMAAFNRDEEKAVVNQIGEGRLPAFADPEDEALENYDHPYDAASEAAEQENRVDEGRRDRWRKNRRLNDSRYTLAWDCALSRVGFDGLEVDMPLEWLPNWCERLTRYKCSCNNKKITDCYVKSYNCCNNYCRKRSFSIFYHLASTLYFLSLVVVTVFWVILVFFPVNTQSPKWNFSIIARDDDVQSNNTDGQFVCHYKPFISSGSGLTATINMQCIFPAYGGFIAIIYIVLSSSIVTLLLALIKLIGDCAFDSDEAILRAAFEQLHPDSAMGKTHAMWRQLVEERKTRRRVDQSIQVSKVEGLRIRNAFQTIRHQVHNIHRTISTSPGSAFPPNLASTLATMDRALTQMKNLIRLDEPGLNIDASLQSQHPVQEGKEDPLPANLNSIPINSPSGAVQPVDEQVISTARVADAFELSLTNNSNPIAMPQFIAADAADSAIPSSLHDQNPLQLTSNSEHSFREKQNVLKVPGRPFLNSSSLGNSGLAALPTPTSAPDEQEKKYPTANINHSNLPNPSVYPFATQNHVHDHDSDSN